MDILRMYLSGPESCGPFAPPSADLLLFQTVVNPEGLKSVMLDGTNTEILLINTMWILEVI